MGLAACFSAASTSPLSIRVRGVEGLARSAVSIDFKLGSVGLFFHLTLSRAAVQHAGNADVMDIDEFAGCLGAQIDARHGLPDDPVAVGGFDLNLLGKLESDDVVADQLAIADAAVMAADQAILDRKLFERQFEPLGGACDEKMPRLRCRLAQGIGSDLDRFAGDRCALVRNARGISQHHDDAGKGYIEFLGDDLTERGANARAKIDMAVKSGDGAVRGDLNERFEWVVGGGACGPRDRESSRWAALRRGGDTHQPWTSARLPAARSTARMISRCAPQRQRL